MTAVAERVVVRGLYAVTPDCDDDDLLVAMVEAALTALSERNVVTLDDERKAAMVSNLLVVLCSENDTQPVVNAGTLYN